MTTMPTTLPETRDLGELEHALEILRAGRALDARLIGDEHQLALPGVRPDATIEITVGTERYRYAVEATPRADRAEALLGLKAVLERHRERALLFTNYITPILAEHCRNLDLQFLDAAGNAYLHAPGLYVFIKGQKPEKHTITTKQGGGTATALRIIFALLNNRELRTATYREIADVAGVALGAVGRVFDDLEARGYVTRGAKTVNRRILEPARLLDEWVTNYPIRLRPKLNRRLFRAQTNDWWLKTGLDTDKAWWGGEVAADRLTNYLKPETYTIYLNPDTADGLHQLVREHRLRADPNGDIEVLNAFWKLPTNPMAPDIVPTMLVYADLVATLEPRNLEVAKLIRERFIDDTLRTP